MSVAVFTRLDEWRSVSLTELNRRASLLDRQEHKYLVSPAQLGAALAGLNGHFDVLEIGGNKLFGYETTYYDTVDLRTYRQHAQGKRRRVKIRSRRYLDSGDCFFEVKLKGHRQRTVKERFVYGDDRHGSVDREAFEFVDRCLRKHYGTGLSERIEPQITMRYRRVTLVGRNSPERVTVDFDLEFVGAHGERICAPTSTMIVEVKSASRAGRADRTLRHSGCRPVRCSKYCVGLNLLRNDLRYNRFKQTLTDHFDWNAPRDITTTALDELVRPKLETRVVARADRGMPRLLETVTK